LDAERFDRLLLTLSRARSRRSVLGLLGAVVLTGLVARDVAGQTCLANGTRCGRAGDLPCCSGWCKRKRGTTKKFCRQAPGQGNCTIEANICAGSLSFCHDGSGIDCRCLVTTRGFSFCGVDGDPDCFACATDADCEQRPGGQAGDRCVRCPSVCDTTTNDRGCVRMCPNPAIP
jgi:hypothetical protein